MSFLEWVALIQKHSCCIVDSHISLSCLPQISGVLENKLFGIDVHLILVTPVVTTVLPATYDGSLLSSLKVLDTSRQFTHHL